jgi:hypothetical protein
MKRKFNLRSIEARFLLVVLASVIVLASAACKSSKVKSDGQASIESSQASPSSGANKSAGSGPGIDLNCVIDRIQNPPEPFHYSYKKSGDNPVIQNADVTPQTIDGSFTNGTFSNTVHGVRSDSDSWRLASGSLMGVAGMSSTVALVNHGSAMVMEEKGSVNGYDTIHYSIDTTRGDYAEVALYKTTLGDGGFEKGDVWVTKEGCPVKLSINSEMHLHNGQVDKVDYELAIMKKQ